MGTSRLEYLEFDLQNILDARSTLNAIEGLSQEIELKSNSIRNAISKRVYIWGTEEVANRIYPILVGLGYEVIGFFDSNPKKHESKIMGLEIHMPRYVNETVIVASYGISNHMDSARQILGDNAISAWEFLLLFPEANHFPWNALQTPTKKDSINWDKILRTGSNPNLVNPLEYWKQVASRNFVGILNDSCKSTHRREQEYFIPEMNNCDGKSVFVDLGAYNGDTIERFFGIPINESVDSRKAIAVEADLANISTLRQAFDNQKVLSINAIVGREPGLAFFNASGDVRGNVALTQTNELVPVITIDDIHNHFPFTHIKFDIEGFETEALKGGKKAIQSGQALWSVASYHRVNDIWQIPEFFLEGYEFMCSSHAQRPWDTTFHFRKIRV